MTNREKLKGMGLLEMFLKNSTLTKPIQEDKLPSYNLRAAFTW